MTTVAAKRLPSGKIQMAWDAQITSGNTASNGFLKVRKINDQFAVGGAGHLRYLNILHRTSVTKIHKADLVDPEFDAEGWLIDTLVPAWAKALSRAGEDTEYGAPEGRAIVVLTQGIFEIGYDFSVAAAGKFAAVGSGRSFALTAMHLGKTAKQAVVVASQLDLYTGGEIKEMTL